MIGEPSEPELRPGGCHIVSEPIVENRSADIETNEMWKIV
jgi:hypothetical protein